MRAVPRPLPAFAVAVIAGLAVLGLPAVTASAAPAPAPSSALAGQPGIDHFNVSQPHSPRLLRALAGPQSQTALTHPVAAAGSVLAPPAVAANAAIPGAAQGIDVASGQHAGGAVNWAQVAGAGYTFAAIKATEGNYYINPYYASDPAAAGAAGLSVIGYSFANPYPDAVPSNGTAAQQAQYLVSHASVGGTVPPLMLDIEYNPYVSQEKNGNECYSLTPVAMVNWIFQFVGEVQSLTGQLPIIYTPHDWWLACTGNSTAFYQDPLWLPDYSATDASPPLMADWTNWALWQYSSSGAVPGISGNTDLDQLNPAVIPLLAPGLQRSMVGSAVTPVTVHAFTVSSSPALAYTATGLPPGLSIDSSSGQISGVPASAGNYQVTVTATGVTGTGVAATGSVTITWQVRGKVTVTSPGTRSTVAGGPVDIQVAAADSAPNETLSYSASGLPAGLTMHSQGLITGWPAAPAGTHSVTVTATDGFSDSGSASFTWTVSAAPGTGPAGPVHLDVAGKCLNDAGNATANGAKIQTWACIGSHSESWTIAQDGTLRIHGKCLTTGGSGAKGSTEVLETCSGAASQQWRAGTGAELLDPASGLCLDDASASPANGAAVDAWSCTGHANQKWTLPAGPVVSQIPGNCLDNTANSSANGNPVEIWTCNGGVTQSWTAEPDGTVRIDGRCLDVPALGAGSPLVLEGCGSGLAAQSWQVRTDGAGVELQNPQSGLCLADPGDSAAKGTHLVMGACSAADPGVDWRIR